VFGVSTDDFVTSDVLQVVLEDLLGEQVDQRLDVLCHVFLVVRLLQRAEVDVGERGLEKLDVECITEKDGHIVDRFFDAQVS